MELYDGVPPAVGIPIHAPLFLLKGGDDMSVTVGSARIDENGKATGGKAGDQTGKEVSTQAWYLHSKGWYVLRAKTTEMRNKIADCMQMACDNKHIGYDQNQRNSLYTACKDIEFDVSKLTEDKECDCSSLVRVCCAYAGADTSTAFRTTNEATVLVNTGHFTKLTDDKHCKKSSNLLRGDILVTRTQGHTVVVLSDGPESASERQEAPSIKDAVVITGNSVNIRSGNGTSYKRITVARKNDEFEYVATAENGWNAVKLSDCIGWVSPTYSVRRKEGDK